MLEPVERHRNREDVCPRREPVERPRRRRDQQVRVDVAGLVVGGVQLGHQMQHRPDVGVSKSSEQVRSIADLGGVNQVAPVDEKRDRLVGQRERRNVYVVPVVVVPIEEQRTATAVSEIDNDDGVEVDVSRQFPRQVSETTVIGSGNQTSTATHYDRSPYSIPPWRGCPMIRSE